MFLSKFNLLLVALTTFFYVAKCQSLPKFAVSSSELTLIINETEQISLYLNEPLNQNVTITFSLNHYDLVTIVPMSMKIAANTSGNFNISVLAESPGHVDVTGVALPKVVDDFNLFFRIIVANSRIIIIVSAVVGWIYFVAWSISFYPQLVINYKRKSVVGLSFDFMALNFMGHTLYAIFNTCLYFVPFFQEEYFNRFPRGLNPVELNDVFFSIHASAITALTILQCFFYERGEQRVSDIARGILGIFTTIIIVVTILSAIGQIHWLDFLNTCSYIKLAITLIKYVPQAILNYKRKSTVGWSIGNILLDFTGGILSMLQMILNSYNYNDWQSIFGDPTKFGLGLFSVLFDILFIIQHYVLYRNLEAYRTIPGNESEANLTEKDEENSNEEEEDQNQVPSGIRYQ
ncbi:hypothetical protein PVAND_003081 [Polypedilum vanderplanki]|uniref:Cystinosin homolog n=1 Tax=Polypedilum vanderplanki TaxID=319348 RepID=A0A9J6BTG5_POLVA|nr:hypothetical protein PVAND_003081 [Polypedilum vanderplanki]